MIRKLMPFVLPLLVLLVPALVFAAVVVDTVPGDPSAPVTAGANVAMDAVFKDGIPWAVLLVIKGLLSSFLARNQSKHWIAQGKTLSALTGVGMVVTAALSWHFAGAPAEGILAAIFAAYTLITSSTVKAPAAGASTGAVTMLVVLLLGSAVAGQAAGCGTGLTAKGVAIAGKDALIDCGETEARNILVQRIAPVVLQVLLNSTSPDGKLIDTAPVKSAIGKIDKGDAYDEARIVLTCAAKVAFAKLSTPEPATPGAPQAAALVIDRAAVQRAEADVMATVAPGARFAVEVK